MGKSAKKVSTLAETTFSQGGLAGSRLTQEIYRPLGVRGEVESSIGIGIGIGSAVAGLISPGTGSHQLSS